MHTPTHSPRYSREKKTPSANVIRSVCAIFASKDKNMTERKDLPPFAFLDGHDGETDHLKRRDIVLHLQSGSLIEFVQDFEGEPSG